VINEEIQDIEEDVKILERMNPEIFDEMEEEESEDEKEAVEDDDQSEEEEIQDKLQLSINPPVDRTDLLTKAEKRKRREQKLQEKFA